jgi:hypothetical protein
MPRKRDTRTTGTAEAAHELTMATNNGRHRPSCACGYRGTSSNSLNKARSDYNQHARRVGAPVVSEDKPSFMWTGVKR